MKHHNMQGKCILGSPTRSKVRSAHVPWSSMCGFPGVGGGVLEQRQWAVCWNSGKHEVSMPFHTEERAKAYMQDIEQTMADQKKCGLISGKGLFENLRIIETRT